MVGTGERGAMRYLARLTIITEGKRLMSVFLRWNASRKWRILSIGGVAALIALQLLSTALRALVAPPQSGTGSFWLFYIAYALVAALFFGVGSLVWIYGYRQQRVVSTLLFAFCGLMTVTFGTLSAPAVGDRLQVAVGSACSALAVLFLLLFLLRFPFDTLADSRSHPVRHLALLIGIGVLAVLCLFSVTSSVCFNYLGVSVPAWWNLLGLLYYGFAGVACVVAVIYATRHATSGRRQQQARLFIAGTLLSFVPTLALTVIPTTLHLHTSVDGTLSMLFLVLFPLTLGYSLLRYQILIFDTFIVRTATRIVGFVGLALLAYALFATGSTLVEDRFSLLLACLIVAGVVFAPVIWWSAASLTERYFFPEARYYERLLQQVHQHSKVQETFNLPMIAQLLIRDTMVTLKAPDACLFFLDDEAQNFALVSAHLDEVRQERLRVHLLDPLAAALSPSRRDGRAAIAVDSPLAAELTKASRPLFLSEATPAAAQEQRGGFSRYLSPSTAHWPGLQLLLAPVHTMQGELIGVLAVAERGDQEHYAGPELEALQKMVRGVVPALETAHLYEVATRHEQRSALEMAHAYEQQRQLNTIKDDLIVHMSHELRTPITEVSGFLELLSEHGDALDPSLRRIFVEKANHGCTELLTMVTTILDASQVSARASAPLPCEAVSLGRVAREEVDGLDPVYAAGHRIVQGEMEQTFAWANAQSLRQIVRNLLSNALKYSPHDTTITLSVTVDVQGVCLHVKDEGSGIPPEELPLLFGKFVRLNRDVSGSIRGTGLGLYICRQMAEAMGGSVWAESSGISGEGSCFHLRLPAPKASPSTPKGYAVERAVA
jgi:signal transduction histidine kinase